MKSTALSVLDSIKSLVALPTPLFVIGAASILDLFGALFRNNTQLIDHTELDRLSICNDWAMVGRDIKQAMGLWDQSHRG